MDAYRPLLDQSRGSSPPATACRAEVGRLLAFRDFAAAPQLRNFLEYIVEETLAQRGDQLKERNIALHALMRDADFDPRLDCVVRVMAGKLRRALERYYHGSEGAAAEVLIEVPRGAYRPVFSRIDMANRVASYSRAPACRSSELPRANGNGAIAPVRPVLAVLPLLPLTEGREELALAEALACEACVQLCQLRWLELLDYLVTRRWRGEQPCSAWDEMHRCDYTVCGTCRRQAGQFRVIVQLTSVGDGHLLWAEQFDLVAAVDNFASEDTIVARICTAVSQLLRPAVQIDSLKHTAAHAMRRVPKSGESLPATVKVVPPGSDRLSLRGRSSS